MTAAAAPAPAASAEAGAADPGPRQRGWSTAVVGVALLAYAGWLGWFVADHSGALYDDAYIYFR